MRIFTAGSCRLTHHPIANFLLSCTQGRACVELAGLISEADDQKAAASSLISHGLLEDLSSALTEVPSAMHTLSVLCDADRKTAAVLLKHPSFLSRAVGLMDTARNASAGPHVRL